jgi:hypothetical protein
MESDGGDVDATDAGDHGVTGFQLAVEDELSEEHGADTVAGAIGAHVDGVFDGETVAVAGAELGGVTKADDIALKLGNEVGEAAIENGLAAAGHFGFIGSDGLECGGGDGGEVAVDGGDVGDVSGLGGTDLAFGVAAFGAGDGKG